MNWLIETVRLSEGLLQQVEKRDAMEKLLSTPKFNKSLIQQLCSHPGQPEENSHLVFLYLMRKPQIVCVHWDSSMCVYSNFKEAFNALSDVGCEEGWELLKLAPSSLNLCPLRSKHASGENRRYAWATEHLWSHDLWLLYYGKCILWLLCFSNSFVSSFSDSLVFSLVLLCNGFKEPQISPS